MPYRLIDYVEFYTHRGDYYSLFLCLKVKVTKPWQNHLLAPQQLI